MDAITGNERRPTVAIKYAGICSLCNENECWLEHRCRAVGLTKVSAQCGQVISHYNNNNSRKKMMGTIPKTD